MTDLTSRTEETGRVERKRERILRNDFVRKHAVVLPNTVCKRLRRGWELERAVLTPSHGQRAPRIFVEHNGERLCRDEFIAKYAVVSNRTVYRRQEKGWTLEQAALTPMHQKPETQDEEPMLHAFAFGVVTTR